MFSKPIQANNARWIIFYFRHILQFVCLLAAVAVCNAGIANYNGAAVIAPTITSESQNVLRSYNGGQVAYQSKTIDTPYSSVSKSDVRVSNPGYAVHQPAVAYGEIIDNYLQKWNFILSLCDSCPSLSRTTSLPASLSCSTSISHSTSLSCSTNCLHRPTKGCHRTARCLW